MEQTFIFLLDSTKQIRMVDRIKLIAETTIKEKKDVPEKFRLAIEVCKSIQSLQPVTQKEFMGFADTVGGYFSASKLYLEKYAPKDPEAYRDHAEAIELLNFVTALLERVKGIWKLGLVK